MRTHLVLIVAMLAAGCAGGGPEAGPTPEATPPSVGVTPLDPFAPPASPASPPPATSAPVAPTSAPSTGGPPAAPTSPATSATPTPSATPTATPSATSPATPSATPPSTPSPTPASTPPTATPTATPPTAPTASPPVPATPAPPGPPPPLTGAYLAAFRVCPKPTGTGCAPAEHEGRLATSEDGGNFTAYPNATPLGAGTPEIIRRGGTVYLYQDDVVHRLDVANGTWRPPADVTLTNANGSVAMGLNASAVLDENGSIVLFHLFARPGQDAGCNPFPDGTRPPVCTKTFRSATEVAGSDGTQFVVDLGNRAVVSTDTTASDPDVFAHPGGYVMLVSVGQGVRVLTSPELRGTYSHREFLTNTSGHTPTGHYDAATSRYWIYVQHGGGDVAMSIKRAIVSTLEDALPESAFVTILVDRGAPSLARNTV